MQAQYYFYSPSFERRPSASSLASTAAAVTAAISVSGKQPLTNYGAVTTQHVSLASLIQPQAQAQAPPPTIYPIQYVQLAEVPKICTSVLRTNTNSVSKLDESSSSSYQETVNKSRLVAIEPSYTDHHRRHHESRAKHEHQHHVEYNKQQRLAPAPLVIAKTTRAYNSNSNNECRDDVQQQSLSRESLVEEAEEESESYATTTTTTTPNIDIDIDNELDDDVDVALDAHVSYVSSANRSEPLSSSSNGNTLIKSILKTKSLSDNRSNKYHAFTQQKHKSTASASSSTEINSNNKNHINVFARSNTGSLSDLINTHESEHQQQQQQQQQHRESSVHSERRVRFEYEEDRHEQRHTKTTSTSLGKSSGSRLYPDLRQCQQAPPVNQYEIPIQYIASTHRPPQQQQQQQQYHHASRESIDRRDQRTTSVLQQQQQQQQQQQETSPYLTRHAFRSQDPYANTLPPQPPTAHPVYHYRQQEQQQQQQQQQHHHQRRVSSDSYNAVTESSKSKMSESSSYMQQLLPGVDTTRGTLLASAPSMLPQPAAAATAASTTAARHSTDVYHFSASESATKTSTSKSVVLNQVGTHHVGCNDRKCDQCSDAGSVKSFSSGVAAPPYSYVSPDQSVLMCTQQRVHNQQQQHGKKHKWNNIMDMTQREILTEINDIGRRGIQRLFGPRSSSHTAKSLNANQQLQPQQQLHQCHHQQPKQQY